MNLILTQASFFNSPVNEKSNSCEFPDVTATKLQVAAGAKSEIFLHAVSADVQVYAMFEHPLVAK